MDNIALKAEQSALLAVSNRLKIRSDVVVTLAQLIMEYTKLTDALVTHIEKQNENATVENAGVLPTVPQGQ